MASSRTITRSLPASVLLTPARTKLDQKTARQAGMGETLDLDSLILNWVSDRVPDVDIKGALTGIQIQRTIEGASTITVTVQDPGNKLFADSAFWKPQARRDSHGRPVVEHDWYGKRITAPTTRGRAAEIQLDGITFRLVQVSKSGDQVTLTFEDRVVYWLRRKKGETRIAASRNDVTRAQFILKLLRQIKAERVHFVCPDLNVRQPIDRPATSTPSADRSRGLPDVSSLRVGGKPATSEQRRIGEVVLAVANDLRAGAKATLALAEACLVESGMRNLTYGDSSSVGVLQLLNLHGSVARRRDVEWCCRQFLTTGFTGRGGAIKLARENPGQTAGWVAWNVQGPAVSLRGRYDQTQAEATAWVAAFAGSGADVLESSAAGGNARYKSYQYAREANEDSWTAMQRLAEEVGWRCFMLGDALYYMAEEDLFRRKPLYVLRPNDPAILSFDYDVDWGKPVSEARVSVVAGRWDVPPGEPVMVEGFGPADGRWLVVDWSRDFFQPVVDITIRQPGKEKMEPAPEEQSDTANSSDLAGPVPSNKIVAKAYARVSAIDAKNQGYKWGGGHGSFNDPGGYDCSGFVSSVLGAAGILETPQSTVGLQNWGHAGAGAYMTVWVKETGDPHASHTFITFNVGNAKVAKFAEAGGANSAHTGWHSPRSLAGFKARHWPGT